NQGVFFGDQVGRFDTVTFAGHTQYAELFDLNTSVDAGGDIEIGYRLPFKNNPKIYVGAYYFNARHTDSIKGGTARLEVPLTENFAITLSDSYDNWNHNTFKAGISF